MEFSGFIDDFENLPKHVQRQLLEYAEFLLSKYQKRKKTEKNDSPLSFSWEDGLDDMRKLYTSVELQHRINELR